MLHSVRCMLRVESGMFYVACNTPHVVCRLLWGGAGYMLQGTHTRSMQQELRRAEKGCWEEEESGGDVLLVAKRYG